MGIDVDQDFLVQSDWILLSDNDLINELKPTADQLIQNQIAEYKAYLASTDHKDLPRYKAKDGEDLDAIFAKRDIAREYIRQNTK